MKKYVIGVDLGGTKISTAVALPGGKMLYEKTIPTMAGQGPKKVIARIKASIIEAAQKASIKMKDVSAIGIGVPGPIIPNKGIVKNPPNLKGWKRVPLRHILSGAFSKKVFLENDANCAALAELKFGAGKKFRNFVYVTVSTGIGGGIILDKKLFSGSTGTAGEVGHMTLELDGPRCPCGKRGHFEGLACGPSFEKRTGRNPKLTGKLAGKGNRQAIRDIEELGKLIGIGFSNIVNILNPEAIIVGGGLSNLGAPFFGSIRKTVASQALAPVKILPAKLKKNTGVLGAIALCL
ncbi:MAG: ROK family protein [Candidatus Margulisiibacteriota bacterium]